MDVYPTNVPIEPGGQQSEAPLQFHGRWLLLARVFWIALALLIIILCIAGLPVGLHYLKAICATPGCEGPQLTPELLRVFNTHGLSADFYAVYSMSFELLFVFVWLLVAAVIFWRKSHERLAWFVSLMLLSFGATFPDFLGVLASQQRAWWWPVNIVSFLGVSTLVLCFFLFPDGRFFPHWTRLLAFLWVAWNGYWLFTTGIIVTPGPWLLSYLVILGFGIATQVYRYRRISNAIQRQQTRWAVYGFSLAIGGFLLLSISDHAFGLFLQPNPLFPLLINPAYYIIMLLIPVFIGIAILRSRLWDIDILINRTLVYGLLTAILALLYFGLIVGLQFLLRNIIDQNNNIAIVVSTLVIYALFQPLRRRIQDAIDRRFYRRKYDAARTLAAFNATLRSEVDLSQLHEQLLAVVQETMQPTHVSLWLNNQQRATESTRHLLLGNDER